MVLPSNDDAPSPSTWVAPEGQPTEGTDGSVDEGGHTVGAALHEGDLNSPSASTFLTSRQDSVRRRRSPLPTEFGLKSEENSFDDRFASRSSKQLSSLHRREGGEVLFDLDDPEGVGEEEVSGVGTSLTAQGSSVLRTNPAPFGSGGGGDLHGDFQSLSRSGTHNIQRRASRQLPASSQAVSPPPAARARALVVSLLVALLALALCRDSALRRRAFRTALPHYAVQPIPQAGPSPSSLSLPPASSQTRSEKQGATPAKAASPCNRGDASASAASNTRRKVAAEDSTWRLAMDSSESQIDAGLAIVTSNPKDEEGRKGEGKTSNETSAEGDDAQIVLSLETESSPPEETGTVSSQRGIIGPPSPPKSLLQSRLSQSNSPSNEPLWSPVVGVRPLDSLTSPLSPQTVEMEPVFKSTEPASKEASRWPCVGDRNRPTRRRSLPNLDEIRRSHLEAGVTAHSHITLPHRRSEKDINWRTSHSKQKEKKPRATETLPSSEPTTPANAFPARAPAFHDIEESPDEADEFDAEVASLTMAMEHEREEQEASTAAMGRRGGKAGGSSTSAGINNFDNANSSHEEIEQVDSTTAAEFREEDFSEVSVENSASPRRKPTSAASSSRVLTPELDPLRGFRTSADLIQALTIERVCADLETKRALLTMAVKSFLGDKKSRLDRRLQQVQSRIRSERWESQVLLSHWQSQAEDGILFSGGGDNMFWARRLELELELSRTWCEVMDVELHNALVTSKKDRRSARAWFEAFSLAKYNLELFRFQFQSQKHRG